MTIKLQEFLKTEIANLNNQPALKADFRVGDIIKVHQLIKEIIVQKKISKTAKAIKKAEGDGGKGATERIQVFEGVVIAKKHGREMGASFMVRKIGASNVAIEKIFPLYSPTIKKIEIVSRPKVRRAKLYYLRERVGKAARRAGLGVAVEQPKPKEETAAK